MNNKSFLELIVIILIVVIVFTIYFIRKLEYRIQRLEYNNNSLMELLLLLQDGAKIERIDTGADEDNA